MYPDEDTDQNDSGTQQALPLELLWLASGVVLLMHNFLLLWLVLGPRIYSTGKRERDRGVRPPILLLQTVLCVLFFPPTDYCRQLKSEQNQGGFLVYRLVSPNLLVGVVNVITTSISFLGGH